MRKQKVVEHLGSTPLLMPAWVQAALQANDRAKLILTMLQAAWQHGGESGTAEPDWDTQLRRLGRRDAAALAAAVAHAGLDDDELQAPGLGRVLGALAEELALMARPLLNVAGAPCDPPVPDALRQRCVHWQSRLQALAAHDRLSHADLLDLTRGDAAGGDSVHLLLIRNK